MTMGDVVMACIMGPLMAGVLVVFVLNLWEAIMYDHYWPWE
ncbi:hypothetical protein LCGC14_2051810 [marine sediment metagenome]|uniref:Uncharacterized protein n=1 Tax=marine sediment metagenome TaxID=412755 RepID=A0A0F9ENZ8_9ZZZZ